MEWFIALAEAVTTRKLPGAESVRFVLVGSIILGLLRVLNRRQDPWARGLAYATIISIVGVMIIRAASSALYTDSYLWVMWALGAAVVRLELTDRRNS